MRIIQSKVEVERKATLMKSVHGGNDKKQQDKCRYLFNKTGLLYERPHIHNTVTDKDKERMVCILSIKMVENMVLKGIRIFNRCYFALVAKILIGKYRTLKEAATYDQY